MDPVTRRLIEAIHRSAGKCVLAVTGGGASAAALLLNVPGGSRTILEVIVPYNEKALVEFLGRRPAQFCSAATSRELAARSYERATWLAPGEIVLGVGCTASLATDRPKRGDHRFYLACHTIEQITTYSLTLRKGERDREAEEAVLDAVLINALAEAYGLTERVPVPLLPAEAVQVESLNTPDLIGFLVRGELPAFCAEPDGRLSKDAPRPAALLSGAFNPVHEGHWRLADTASKLLGKPVAFELSVLNVDKPVLTTSEIRRRLQQFSWRAPVWVTRTPTFAEKASVFPGAIFVVGADTAERIIAPRYYQESETRLAEALERIRQQRCRFLVAARPDGSGKPIELSDLSLPAAYRDLFSGIAKADFHMPISSTDLRQQAANERTTGPLEGAE
jgi:nicotinic acid mononucleotide adenylyltransferase